MKKFVIICTLLVLLGIGGWYSVSYQGFFIDMNPDAPVTAQSKATGDEIYVRDVNGAWKPFTVRGVVIRGSLPGFLPNEYQPDEKMYLQWMKETGELGANTIRVYTVMDDDFYNALHNYNTTNDAPLYLLQSIRVTEYMNNSAGDAYDMSFGQELLRDAKQAVDVVHGNVIIPENKTKGSGTYRKDVSDWVLGFIVGQEWNASTIAYTDNRNHSTAYFGKYIRTKDGATAFEAMLAQVMDQLVQYESGKYKQQHLVSFINDPQHDPFDYEQLAAKRLAKFSQLDIEHLEAMDNYESGLFAAYRVYQLVPDFWSHLSQEQMLKLGDIPDRVDNSLHYEGYTQLLAEYHTMPVIIVSFSNSSARGMANMQKEDRLTEQRQGEMFVEVYKDIITSGCNGAVVSGLTDYWGQRTWNTFYAVDLNRAHMWHDLQSSAQGTGLLAFVPGETHRIVTVDGDSSEWLETEPLLENGGRKLYVKYDEEGLYLCIIGDVSPAVPLYVSFDLTPKTGSKTFSDARLQFDRGIDFVLRLQGKDGDSRLVVQERYEALRSNFLYETQRKDAYVNPPDKDIELFVPILQAVIPLAFQMETPVGQVPPPQYSTVETGVLVQGNADSDSENYNSLADYCYGPGVVEVRIPWAMLNFSDPSKMMIHDDYYENYGVKSIAINKMEIGLTAAGGRTEFQTLPLTGWDTVQVHEHRKQSYYILQQEWGLKP